MQTMMLWLDDIRPPNKHPHITSGIDKVIWVQSYQEAIKSLRSLEEHITHISLDNDLGSSKEGKDVLSAVEQLMFYQKLLKVKCINLHSHNPSAVHNMYSTKEYMLERYNVSVTKVPA